LSLRAVVERRQQIGVLRAIGYRRRMVQLSFLTESSFVVLMGTADDREGRLAALGAGG